MTSAALTCAPSSPESSLAKAAQMLAEADTIQKAKELKSLALTAADWAKRKGMGEEAIQHCRSYALEAERKMGEMLAATERAKGTMTVGGGGRSGGHVVLPPERLPTLSDLGLSKRESAEAQALAALPTPVFEAVKEGRKTRAQIKREIKEQNRETRREANRAKVAQAPALVDAKFATIVIDPPWDWGEPS